MEWNYALRRILAHSGTARPEMATAGAVTCTDGICWIVAAARLATELMWYFSPPDKALIEAANRLAGAPKDNRLTETNEVITYIGWADAYASAVKLLNPPGSMGHAAGLHVVETYDEGGNPVAAFHAMLPIPITLVPYEDGNIDHLPTVEDTATHMQALSMPAMIVHEVWARRTTPADLNKCIESHRHCAGNDLVGGFISLALYTRDARGDQKREHHAIAFYLDFYTQTFLCIDPNHTATIGIEDGLAIYGKEPFIYPPNVSELCLIYAAPAPGDPDVTMGFVDLCM